MADGPAPAHSGAAITILKVEPRQAEGIAVSCAAFGPEGAIPDRYSAWHDNVSPPLQWTDVPGVGAWALIVEDPDAPRDLPFVHWLIWNLPATSTRLTEGVPRDAHPLGPQGSVQGRNDGGGLGWMGPRPPAGHGVHRYYFQLFALDGPLALGPEADLVALTNAIKGRVIAQGQLVGTYERPDESPGEAGPAATDEAAGG